LSPLQAGRRHVYVCRRAAGGGEVERLAKLEGFSQSRAQNPASSTHSRGVLVCFRASLPHLLAPAQVHAYRCGGKGVRVSIWLSSDWMNACTRYGFCLPAQHAHKGQTTLPPPPGHCRECHAAVRLAALRPELHLALRFPVVSPTSSQLRQAAAVACSTKTFLTFTIHNVHIAQEGKREAGAGHGRGRRRRQGGRSRCADGAAAAAESAAPALASVGFGPALLGKTKGKERRRRGG